MAIQDFDFKSHPDKLLQVHHDYLYEQLQKTVDVLMSWAKSDISREVHSFVSIWKRLEDIQLYMEEFQELKDEIDRRKQNKLWL